MLQSSIGALMANAETSTEQALNPNDAGQQSQQSVADTASVTTTQADTTQDAAAVTTEQQVSSTDTDATIVQNADEHTDVAKVSFDFDQDNSQQQSQTTDAAQAQQQQAAAQTDWKVEVKKANIQEVAELIGLDPFVVGLNEYIKSGGAPMDYLQAKAFDWDKIPDVDVMRREFGQKYPHLSAEEQDYLFSKKYGVTEFDDDDVKRDKEIALKADSYEIKQRNKAEQAKLPEPTPQIKQEADPVEQARIQAEQQKLQNDLRYITEHDLTKNLMQGKRVTVNVGEGIAPFNFDVDRPEVVMQMWADQDLWNKVLHTKTGEPDVSKLQRMAMVALNPNYEKALVDYGKSLGRKSFLDEGINAKRPTGSAPAATNQQGVVVKNVNGRVGSLS